MFQRILVPLDGSVRAEEALVLAARLARASGGSLCLLRVVNTAAKLEMYGPGAAIFLQDLQSDECMRATAYLATMAYSPSLQGIKVRIATFIGDPATTVLDASLENDTDLIVLCSHGYTGIKRWALG